MHLCRITFSLISLMLFTMQAASAKFILTAPPREKVEVGEKYYGTIAKELSKIIGEEVVYRHPHNWTEYAKDMRAGKYDIVFDGPHFAAWRIKNVGHIPIARLSGTLRFYVMSHKSDSEVQSMRDLIGKQLCGLASPHLGTVSAFNLYNNPVIQPDIQVVRGGMRNVMKKFLDGSCRAAIVRDKLYNKLPEEKRAQINIIAKSLKMPNQSITVSSRINRNKLKKMAAFLISDSGSASAKELLQRFSKKKKFFIPSRTKEFAGLSGLLEGVVFGW